MSDAEDVPLDFDGHEMQLVMPFVVCKSNDGPYDDDSFTAGWHCAQIDWALQVGELTGATRFGFTVRTASLPQFDLIGMRRGYTMTTVDWSEEPLGVSGDPAEDYANWQAATSEWTRIVYATTEDGDSQ